MPGGFRLCSTYALIKNARVAPQVQEAIAVDHHAAHRSGDSGERGSRAKHAPVHSQSPSSEIAVDMILAKKR